MPVVRLWSLFSLFALLAASGCGGGGDAGESMPGESMNDESMNEGEVAAESDGAMSVRITEPEDGATIEGSSVRVVFEVENLEVVPAGVMDPGTGHHHLIVNAELTPADQPIPAIEGSYIHFGLAQTEYEMTELEAGDYTIIAVVADGVHVPLQPWVVDTVRFTVR